MVTKIYFCERRKKSPFKEVTLSKIGYVVRQIVRTGVRVEEGVKV